MKKNQLLNFLAQIILCCLFINSLFANQTESIPADEKIAIKIINEAASNLKKRHNINPCGIGMSGMKEFESLKIDFQVRRPLSKSEARQILLDCVEEVIEKVNSNEAFRAFLKEYPFTYKNISIALYIRDKKGKSLFHPSICAAECSRRGLKFKTDDPEKEYQYKEISEETYEEALRLVNSNNKE